MAEHDSSSSSKRQRINQACDQCRKRKSKCDGEQPSCATCRSLGKFCTYGTPAKKRGLPTGYVRGVEALLGLFQKSLPNGEYKLQRVLREHLVGHMADSDYLEQASDIWRSSALAKDLDHLLNIADDNDTPRPSSGADRALRLPPIESASPVVQHQPPGDPFERLEQFLDVPPPNLPDNVQEIVDYYFRTTHCWFPILERRTVLRALYHDESHDETGCGREGYRLCLWAIIAYTSATMGGLSSSLGSVNPDSIQAYIRLCLNGNEREFSIGNAQALIILALFNIGMRRLSVARLLLSQVFCMLVDVSPDDRRRSERYQHTIQGCFFLDRILSTHMCKPPLFPDAQVGELDESALDEWEPWIPLSHDTSISQGKQPLRSISCFNLMNQIAGMLPPFHLTTYSAMQLRDKIEDLGSWYSNLKKHHQLHSSTAASPPILLLHLTYKFSLLVLLEQAQNMGMQTMPLAEETVNWTIQLLIRCFEADSVLFGNPLIVVFAFQIQSYVSRLQVSGSNELNHSIRMRCFRFLENFQKQYKFGRPGTIASDVAPSPMRSRQAREPPAQTVTASPLTNVPGMAISEHPNPVRCLATFPFFCSIKSLWSDHCAAEYDECWKLFGCRPPNQFIYP